MHDHVTLCRMLWQNKQALEVVDREWKKLQAEKADLEFQIIKALDARDLTKQHLPEFGTVYVHTKYAVQVPKTIEDKRELFGFIQREKGDDALVGFQTIHSATLNVFHQAEHDAAAKAGNFRWALPGVGEPKGRKTIGMRKG